MNQHSDLVEALVYTPYVPTRDPEAFQDRRLRPAHINLSVWLHQAEPQDIVGLVKELQVENSTQRGMYSGPLTLKAIDYLGTKYQDVGVFNALCQEQGLRRMISIHQPAFRRWVNQAGLTVAARSAVDDLLSR